MTSCLNPSRLLYPAPPSGAEWVVTGLVCAGVLAWLVAAGSAPWWVSVVEAVVAGLLAAGLSWVGRAGLRVLSWIGVVVACSLGFALLSRVQSVWAEALLPVVAGATLGSALGVLVHTRIFGVSKPVAPRLIRVDEPGSAAVEAEFLSARPSGVVVLESERQHLIVSPADAARVEVVWLPGSAVIAQARLGITTPADAEGSVRVLRGGGDTPTVSAQRTLARERAVDVARGFRSSGGQLPAFAGIEWVDDRRAAEAARRSVRLAEGA